MSRRLKGKQVLKGNLLDEIEKDRIKDQVDIVSVISSYGVVLDQKGSSFMGKCPFHDDKTPSLSVDREKGLFNCFGCGVGGDVFDFVMKRGGVGFREALESLRGFNAVTEKENDVRALRDLEEVADYYHRKLVTGKKGRAYLESRGLYKPELLVRLKVGYCPGDLKIKLPQKRFENLQLAGIFTESGREALSGCVVFPLTDSHGKTIGFYGRQTGSGSVKHLYLKGGHRGLFNSKVYKVYKDRLILAESVLDAFSLMVLGLDNVSCLYGTNGFSRDHLTALKESRTREVVLALDSDDAGKKAADKLTETLHKEKINLRQIFPSEKDWNEFLLAGGRKEKVLELIENSLLYASLKNGTKEYEAVKENGRYVFTMDTAVYRVLGVKEGFLSSLKVNIRCYRKDEESGPFIDNVDLFSARSRSLFSLSVSRRFSVDAALVEKHLLLILGHIEEASESLNGEMEDGVVLSDEDRKEGLALLESPDLFKTITDDLTALGYVGEEENKILMYLAASSRLLDDPVSIIVISQSSAGKSYLIDTVKKLMPDEDVVSMTSLSDQALNYLPDDQLLHKFLIMGEAVHSDSVDHQMREMLSGKELSRLVTVKDDKSGKMVSRLVRKKVLVSAVMSSTSNDINPENASRCFVINTDESEEQTRAIHQIQRKKYSLENYKRKEEEIPEITRRHKSAQRLLEKRLIVNPFAGKLNFPSSLMRSRRDHERFVDLIACVCHLRQFQKKVKKSGGREYIECDLEDYRQAYSIMKSILPSTLSNIPKSAVLLFESLQALVKEKAEKDFLTVNDIWVTQRQIREHCGLSHDMVKRNIRLLVEYEYVRKKGSGRGMTAMYGLASDSQIVLYDTSLLMPPEQLEQSGVVKGKTGNLLSEKELEQSGVTGVVDRKANKLLLLNDLEKSGA